MKKNDIFLGCTNVGKSSIFNTLLESDLCKEFINQSRNLNFNI